MSKIPIEVIAEYADLPPKTVSDVLVGNPRVSLEAVEKVRSAVKALGYGSGGGGRNLSQRITKTFGFYVPPPHAIKEDPGFSELFAGVMEGCHQFGYQLHVYADYLAEPFAVSDSFTPNQPTDGALIMNPRNDGAYMERLISDGLPFVVIGMPGADTHAWYVAIDILAVTKRAAKALIDSGKKRILCICGPEAYVQTTQRIDGLLAALAEAQLSADTAKTAFGDFNEHAGYRLYKEMVATGFQPDGVLAATDVMAVGAARAIKEQGLRIPEDVGVVGEGNTLLSRYHSPALCTTNLHLYDLGVKSASLLVEFVEKRTIEAGHVDIPAEFVTRESI